MIGDPVHPAPLRDPLITLSAVDYDHPSARALRRAMILEMGHRYADRGAGFGAHAVTLTSIES